MHNDISATTPWLTNMIYAQILFPSHSFLIESVVGRHLHTRLGGYSIFTLPQTSDCFGLGVETEPWLAVEGVGAAAGNAFLVPCEAEHGQWDGNGHVNADLTGLDVFLEACCGASAPGEDCDAVSILVCVDEVDGVVDCGDAQTNQNRAEDFLLVALHMRLDVGYQSGTDLRGGLLALRL